LAQSQLEHIDVRRHKVTDKISVGLNPSFIALAGGDVWTICAGDGTVWRISPPR
jgi:hypothetical protein